MGMEEDRISKLVETTPHTALNQFEHSLQEAFKATEPQLKPPFPLTIPSPSHYSLLNQSLLYSLLTQSPHLTKLHFTHLHSIVTDAYQLFTKMLLHISLDLYPNLLPPLKAQLLVITRELVRVSALGYDALLLSLLRHIVGGDFSHPNLWLCTELLRIVFYYWDCLLEEHPLLLTSVLYVYLRLLPDHCRLAVTVPDPKLEVLKRMEIDFCVRVLRNHFGLCMSIGRDLIRLLQDLVCVPDLLSVWKDLLLNPSEFKVPGFLDISQLYCSRTSSRYHLLRITPEMENQLRFLLTHVQWGSQRRYQAWFARKYLCTPERDTVVSDIVRFICCAHHPPNEVIQSNAISRWAVVGWLINSCRNNHVQANAKLALLYDWLFYDEKVDNIMNIEPAMLLMVNSIPKYVDMTQALLDFLFQLMDNYDVQRKDLIVRGVSAAFKILVRKGVVQSLEALTSCTLLSSFVRERLANIFHTSVSGDFEEAQGTIHVPKHSIPPVSAMRPSNLEHLASVHQPHQSMPPPSLPRPSNSDHPIPVHLPHHSTPPVSSSKPSNLEPPIPLLTEQTLECPKENNSEASFALDSSVATCTPPVLPNKTASEVIVDLVQSLGEAVKQSNQLGLQVLEEILCLLAIDGSLASDTVDSVLHPEALACQIGEAFKVNGYSMFFPPNLPPKVGIDDELHSATSLVISTFIFCQHRRMQEMLLFWSKNGFPVGPHFLSYASRLAYEVHSAGCLRTPLDEKNSTEISYLEIPFLKNHIDKHVSFMTSRKNDSTAVVHSALEIDSKFMAELVKGAFASYGSFLMLCNVSHRDKDVSPTKLLLSDILCCCGWKIKSLSSLFYNIFSYLPDLSTGKEEYIRLLVHQLDHADLVALQFDVCLGRFSMFGDDTGIISHLIKSSLNWDFLEQQKFWGLIASELAVSNVMVEKVVADFFSLDVLDPKLHSIAVGGLLTLCARRAPTLKLVSIVLSLSDNTFGGFGASVLANWVVSNGSMLFDSLAKCLEEVNSDQDHVLSSSVVSINHSSILNFLGFLDKQGKDVQGTSNLSVRIKEIKANLKAKKK